MGAVARIRYCNIVEFIPAVGGAHKYALPVNTTGLVRGSHGDIIP